MFSKGGLAVRDVSRKKERFTSSWLTRPGANGSGPRACKLSALAILLLLAACASGCVAAGRKSGVASVPHLAKDNPGSKKDNPGSKSENATNTPATTSHQSEGMLATIRQELAVGNYTKAHQDLAVVAQHDDQLTQAERRETKDNVCLTEYLIGQGSYPLSEQQRTCSEALAEPGSVSGAILARIHDSLKQFAAEQVRRALEAQDLAGAEAVALAYRTSPGADSELLAGWSKDFWQVVHGQERPAEREQRVTSLIAELSNEYPQAKTMSEPDFGRWVIGAAAVSNKSIISSFTTKGDTLDLLVLEHDLPVVASNLYEFVRINDVFAARCACDARTNVGVADLGFPAYLFRLDPEERTSKVLIALGQSAAGATLPIAAAPGESAARPVEAKAPTVRSAIEPSQDASTEGKPSPASASAGPAGTNRAARGSPAAASGSLPQPLSSGEPPKSKAKPSASGSNLQPSGTQPTQRPIGKVEPRGSDMAIKSPNPRAQGNWEAIAYKSRHELAGYFKGRWLKRYAAVFGSNFQAGTKLWEGDRRTPEGTYTVVAKYPSRRWNYFLLLNYPNTQDRINYQRLQRAGLVATANGVVRSEGGSIGIHGTDQRLLNERKLDWTAGCISVDNRAIAELYRLLPVGAAITIRP